MSIASKYQIALIGRVARRDEIEALLFGRLKDLGVSRARVKIFIEDDIEKLDPKSPVVVVFFGYSGANDADHDCLPQLLRDSVTIVPCVSDVTGATDQLPPSLHHINAFPLTAGDPSIERLVGLILENLKLLRAERRLFISYRRAESQSVAIQLYERLDAAGFDVFLDTRGVPYGTDFQAVLWHRMADSDVVVLLDTPNFRASKWTIAELSRANSTNVQILHLLWPDVLPDASSAFSEFMVLGRSDFRTRAVTKEHARLTDAAAAQIVTRVESLRARALAARHRSLVDSFCDKAREEGVKSVAVQPERFIHVELGTGHRVAVVPTVGVPRADRCHDIEKAIAKSKVVPDRVWLLYDDRGILDAWIEHLDWLNKHLPVSVVQITKCTSELREGVA
jgi:hypothetical protein